MAHTDEHKPVYKKIAVDVAHKIVKGEIKEKEKISGRSVLASMYNVSPETIRRAVALLHEMGVVAVSQGSGIEVLSISAAEKFINKTKDNDYITTIKENIMDLLEERKKLDDEIKKSFEDIVDSIDRFHNISPFTLIEVEIEERCKMMGKRVNEIKFWQSTKATIIAYKRGWDIIISPGPDYVFTKGDVIVVIGCENVYDTVRNFLYND